MATGDKKPVVMAADRDVANGVATLGADAKLNDSQIPMQKIMAVTNAAEYSQTQTYVLGAYCTRGGKLYRCTTAISAAEVWTDAHWTETTVGAELVAVIVALAAKAPAGYGLGESQGRYVANASVDTLTKNGWYYLYDGVTGGPSGLSIYHAILFVSSSRSDLTKVQRLILATSGRQGQELRRVYKDGSWLPWEWIDPPMELGVEYRTTERYDGKAVTRKLVNCGAIANGKTVQLADNSKYRIISANVRLGSAPIPYWHNGAVGTGNDTYVWNAYFNIGGSFITLYCGSSAAEAAQTVFAEVRMIPA